MNKKFSRFFHAHQKHFDLQSSVRSKLQDFRRNFASSIEEPQISNFTLIGILHDGTSRKIQDSFTALNFQKVIVKRENYRVSDTITTLTKCKPGLSSVTSYFMLTVLLDFINCARFSDALTVKIKTKEQTFTVMNNNKLISIFL